jgi:hypothetical protein
VNYMKERSHLTQRKDVLDVRGSKLTKKEREELEGIDTRLRTLKNMKMKILNEIIFPSMANLTFFFEAISLSSPLQADFGDAVRDLLGIKRQEPNFDNYAFMFVRLVSAMLSVTGPPSPDYEKTSDFTLRLIHILQMMIKNKLELIELFRTPGAMNRVFEDISRAAAWTELISSGAKDEYDLMKSIPKDFENVKAGELTDLVKKTKEEFYESIKKDLPTRTFDFNSVKLLQSHP